MDTWQACLAAAPPRPLNGHLYRLVESQQQVATLQLVDSLAAQSVLEELLETSKPRFAAQSEHAGRHWLFITPFRYPPLTHGSRFGARHEPSLFYGAHTPRTALAEAAYYRLVFWHGMAEPPPRKLDTQHTLFGADYATALGVQLQHPPFDAHREVLMAPDRYTQTQALGTHLREIGVQAFEYRSARDREGGINVGLFTPAALLGAGPTDQQAWLCETTGTQVSFAGQGEAAVLHYSLAEFAVAGVLPQPAL